ncbi:MAG: SH3 domain-containing protein [Firmicutes bacterium]|nr:SH3 domain-containing protein [Bacillota bacterium]MDY6160822.1 SH3 domain-containing protein [Candidatus Faecousia sp.]
MKRKFTCMILALVLVISLLPLGAIHTQAASNLNYSENVVSLIKQFEGFSAVAYWDVNQWSIGYGTPGYANQTISEYDADLALRSRLNTINQKINQFTATYNVNLNQAQHDALICFSFNCGTDWTTQGGRFFNAVVNNAGVNEFLFAISLWANVNSTPDTNLINRRLAEANLYLRGVYSKSAPSDYTYVILDPNGGTPGSNGEDKVQAYVSGSNVNILAANPTRSGYSFAGWFTAPTGGTAVKYLSTATAGRTLYAQYGVPVYISTTYAPVYSGTSTSSQIGTVSGGSQVVIVETAQVNGATWGRYADGWIQLANTSYTGTSLPSGSGSSTTTSTTNGTVVCNTGVNVRSGAGTNYPVVGSAYNGQRVTIYETVNVNGSFWGRIGDGRWISLNYVKLDSSSSGSGSSGSNNNITWEGEGGSSTGSGSGTGSSSYLTGTVTATGLNVRAAAGTGSAIVGALKKGNQVKIYAQTTVGNTVWGQTDTGWVCMNYISLNGTSSGGSGSTGTVIATGTVKSNTNLNVRSGAGTNYPRVGTITSGTAVNIYEKTTVNGMEWGRIGTNMWVCLAYINLNTNTGSTGSTGSGGSTATTGTGTVISSTNLNVRSGAGANYTKVGSLTPGSTVTVYEVVTSGTQQWGRIGNNMWVCMSYVRMNSSGTTVPSTGYTGKVISSTQLNVRAAAGTNNAIVGRLAPGTTVTVYELTNVNGVSWGRIATGWVCMQYIQLTSTGSGSNSGISWQ